MSDLHHIQAVVPVSTMAEEFPAELPSFEDPTDILDAEPTVPEAFRVQDDESAGWVVRHINEARARAERIKVWAAKERSRAEKEEAFFLKRFGGELELWAKGEVAKGKKKSVSLPGGTVGFRKKAAGLVIDDDRGVLEWAKQSHPELVVTVIKESVPTADLKALFKKTGEVPPDAAAHIEDEKDEFFVKG